MLKTVVSFTESLQIEIALPSPLSEELRQPSRYSWKGKRQWYLCRPKSRCFCGIFGHSVQHYSKSLSKSWLIYVHHHHPHRQCQNHHSHNHHRHNHHHHLCRAFLSAVGNCCPCAIRCKNCGKYIQLNTPPLNHNHHHIWLLLLFHKYFHHMFLLPISQISGASTVENIFSWILLLWITVIIVIVIIIIFDHTLCCFFSHKYHHHVFLSSVSSWSSSYLIILFSHKCHHHIFCHHGHCHHRHHFTNIFRIIQIQIQ